MLRRAPNQSSSRPARVEQGEKASRRLSRRTTRLPAGRGSGRRPSLGHRQPEQPTSHDHFPDTGIDARFLARAAYPALGHAFPPLRLVRGEVVETNLHEPSQGHGRSYSGSYPDQFPRKTRGMHSDEGAEGREVLPESLTRLLL